MKLAGSSPAYTIIVRASSDHVGLSSIEMTFGEQVVDLSRLAPGPYASMLLGDLGADVLLVEAPMGAIQGMNMGGDDEAAQRRRAHNALARNKRSIVVNLKSEEGRALVHELARDADVFLEGFRPGVTDRLGVGYEAIAETNPGIV